MDASADDELTHLVVNYVPPFGAPFATVHVNLKTNVLRPSLPYMST